MRPSINDLMKRAAAGSYDEKFKKEMSNNIFDKYSQRESFDFDLTNQDYLKGDENPYTYNMGLNENAEDPFNEIRATNQSGVEQLGLGLVRATNKAATEVAKLAPIIYGVGKAMFEDNETSALEDIFNNEGIKALDEMSQKINTELLPVYVKDSVKNGTLMDNLLSTSFYATEGADGIGFMASMFVPGMILSKFSLGSKLIGGLSKVSKLTKMVETTEGSVQVLKGLGWSGRAIDSKIAVLTNSMIESGAESKGTQDALKSEKLNEIELYKSKGLSQEEAEQVFNQKHPDWDNQVASAMKGDFWMQMPMLLGTGSMMHKAIFGKALDKVEKTVEYGLKGRLGSIAKQWGKATLSEGFIEEAGQSTLENYYTKKAYEGKLGKGLISDVNIGDLTKEYINTVSSVEGQKAIFLGALMGGPFMSMEARREYLKGLKDTNSITNGVKSSIDDYNTIKENDIYEKDPNDSTKPLFKRDENGNITSEKIVNREKALEVAKSLKNIEDDDVLYDEAIKSDDSELQKFIQNRNILKLIAPAIQNGKLGLQILKEELEQTLKFTDISEADKNSKDENNTNKKLVESILAKAEHLQKQNEKFKDFSPDIIKLDDPRTTKELNEEYLNHLNSKYIETKSLQYDAENNLKELNKKRNNILDELGLDKDLQIEDEIATKKEQSSSLLKQVSDKIRETEKEINKYKKDVNELWENKDLINKSFKSYINEKETSQKQTSEENVQKADDLINNVKNTSNKNELDTLLLPAHKPQPTIEDYEKEIEYKAISEIADSISNDDSIENLKFNLEKLKSLTITSLKLNDVINDLEEKLTQKLQEIEDFKDILLEAIGKYDEQNKKINDFISELNTEIDSLLKSKDTLIKSLDAQDKSPKGRNAKLIKELIKDAQNELKKVEKEIEYLEGLKKEAKKELKQAEKELDYIFNRYDQVDRSEFSSVQDIIDYLNSNKELFKDHRFDFERLLVNKYYTEQNVEGLSIAIDELENYADVLKRTIRSLLDSTENHSEDLYYLQEQLNDTTENLNQAKKDLKVAQEKLSRINKSITDKQAIESINEELNFWNELKEYKKKTINPLINNPVIQEVIEQKKEEFKQQEEEEIEQSKEEQLNLEEEAVINEEELSETIEPTITLDENDKFQSESIPTLEDEVDDNEVIEDENMSEKEVDDELKKEISGAKVISTNRETGETLYDNLQDFVDYERTPRDKSKDIVTFDVGEISNGDVQLAYNKLVKGDTLSSKEISLLEDKLPIRVDIQYNVGKEIKTVSSFIEAKTKANQSDVNSKEALEQQTIPLRRNIIAQAIKNKSLEGIQSNIVKQYPGLLKVDYNEEGVAKNDIFDLQVFDDMNEAEKVDYFQRNTAFVDWSGNLVSTLNKNKKIRTNFGVEHKGEVFLKIPQNNGTEFWLKLNVAKISEAKAEAVYEIVNALSQVSQTINSPTSFQAMTIDTFFETLAESNPQLSEKIKDTLSYEIALVKTFNKGKTQNESLSRFLDLIIYHKSQNAKTGFHLSKDGNLKLGSLAMHLVDGSGFKHLLHITKDELNTPEAKQIIMEYVQYKRHNILITKDSANLFIFNNKEYVKYLLNSNEPLLTTNAVVNQPTFQGYSNVYLNQEVSNTTEENKSVTPMKPQNKNKSATEDVDISIEVSPINEQGENLQTKSAFEALLKVKSQPKTKQDVKMDIDYIKDSYKKASDDVKAEILFTLAENLNAVDDIDFGNLTETFNKLIDSAVKANKSIQEINKICGL